VLPKGLHRIRHYGLFANGNRATNIAQAREFLAMPSRELRAVVHRASPEPPQSVESGCGAVVLGRPCRLPPLSSGGALVGRP
jgi:hypothetical protein